MPVENHAIHHKVRHARPPAGCYNRPANPVDPVPARTFTGEIYFPPLAICRQIGRKYNGAWVPLDECMGCTSAKDEAYIEKARLDIDQEMKRFIKAEQRLL